MHPSTFWEMSKFVEKYLDKKQELKILEIGSRRVSANIDDPIYKDLLNNNLWSHTGLDILQGANVDIVSKELYHYPVDSDSFDVIISGQCIEHVPDLHLWIKEISRVVKQNGLVCIIGPHSWPSHEHIDCWRVWPDGMKFLMNSIGGLEVIECYHNLEKDFHPESNYVGDTVGIGRKIS